MLRKSSILAGVVMMASATASFAEEHIVIVLPDTFFPSISYVDPGDTIRFINNSAKILNIVSQDETWQIGPVPEDAEQTLSVMDGMNAVFYDADQVNEEGLFVVEGSLSFDEPPLSN